MVLQQRFYHLVYGSKWREAYKCKLNVVLYEQHRWHGNS